eukprot:comp22277_c1_seq1/m.32969 comp22277_c1_seq1/g.32969  ORF comp22277_c1_seq1/g.32969 comp22277_c1_seq1/m.32969 type:complete len:403 (-) comp22277_c1_seq1:134-1342(-)
MSGLLLRRLSTGGSALDGSTKKPLDGLRNLDAFPKTLEDFRVKTVSGALVSVIAGLIMLGLFVSELNFYLTTSVRDELLVDTSMGEKMRIDMDITIHHLPCVYLSVDAMDVSGAQQFDVVTNLYKRRLRPDGIPVDEAAKSAVVEEVGLGDKSSEVVKDPTKDPHYCGDCYGAATEEKKCCNTCLDVREAYSLKKWAIEDYSGIEQCMREGWMVKVKEQVDEGCNVFGYLEVNKVAGNFHFAPGKSFQNHNMHIHDIESLRHVRFNMSHTVNSLAFGNVFPGIINPLDGMSKTSDDIAVMYQYFLKVVPTVYRRANGEEVKTNQFSFTAHDKVINYGAGDHGLPGVFINYDMSPILVKITEENRSFFHFLTSVCAIVGGVFAVAGLIDTLIYRSTKALNKRE